MCFYHDYDFTYEVCEEDSPKSAGDTRCSECRRVIPDGEVYRRVLFQEYEVCRLCTYEQRQLHDGDGCPCEQPDHGNEGRYSCCHECDCVLRTIEAVEISRGCTGDSTRPACFMLREAMQDEDGDVYAAKVLEAYPHLEAHLKLLDT